MKFEWDINKSLINIKKHKVSFDEDETLLYYESLGGLK